MRICTVFWVNILSVADVVRCGKLKFFRHLERKCKDYWVSASRVWIIKMQRTGMDDKDAKEKGQVWMMEKGQVWMMEMQRTGMDDGDAKDRCEVDIIIIIIIILIIKTLINPPLKMSEGGTIVK